MTLLKLSSAFLVVVFVLAFSPQASAAPLWVAYNVAAYKALGLGGCQIGDLLFFNFDNTTSTATRNTQTPAAAPNPTTDIIVTPSFSGSPGVSETITMSMAV